MTDTKELKSCPFCGDELTPERCPQWKPASYLHSSNGCVIENSSVRPYEFDKWNARTPDQSAQPDEAELVRIVLGMLDMYYRVDTRPIWIDTQAADIITALRPYLNDGKRVKELEAALAGVMEDLELRATPYDAGGLKLNCSRSVVRAAYKALKEATK